MAEAAAASAAVVGSGLRGYLLFAEETCRSWSGTATLCLLVPLTHKDTAHMSLSAPTTEGNMSLGLDCANIV